MADECGISRFYSVLYINIFLLYLITFTAANCDVDTNGLYRFGPNCRYLCHCMNTEQCHDKTGLCTSGCGFEWVGPGCQYNNIAEGRDSRHLDNQNPAMYSNSANNNDITTCSKTNNSSASRTVAPWWRVFLPYKATIRGLEFITLTESIKYFSGFNVSIETIPESLYSNQAYYPETQQLCYNHDGTVPGSTTITANCATEHVGNQVRIQLTSTATQLVLCDVRIYGGRNLAIGGLATQSTSDSANKAVDGIWKFDSSSCSITAQESNPWWSINLRRIMRIDSIEMRPYTDDLIGYYHVSVSNDSTTWLLVHTDSTTDPHTEIEVHAIAHYLKIGMSGVATLGVCEVRVFGDCQENMCGYDCTKKCYCKNSVISVEDRMLGICTSGCLGRWIGVGEQCDIECTDAQWGQSCEKQCGNCYASAICDVTTGECPAGCDAGYMNTPTCTTVCVNGYYGGGCSMSCGENCQRAGGYICDHVNGTCLQGCNPGWDGAYCDTACQSGSWGQACKTVCGHCSEGPCNAVNGECDTGCSAGYKTTPLCNTAECPSETTHDPTYGTFVWPSTVTGDVSYIKCPHQQSDSSAVKCASRICESYPDNHSGRWIAPIVSQCLPADETNITNEAESCSNNITTIITWVVLGGIILLLAVYAGYVTVVIRRLKAKQGDQENKNNRACPVYVNESFLTGAAEMQDGPNLETINNPTPTAPETLYSQLDEKLRDDRSTYDVVQPL